MKCPNCNETLLMTERQNVEIDYCPSCRGVWLDKGELDKLLEHAAGQRADNGYAVDREMGRNKHAHEDSAYIDRHDREREHYADKNKYPHGRRKKSFLSDFFDFD
ncbi:TFIIB-type zinc ribbon-containing protein [Sphingobacterium suaedae]|uniref:Zf-TFIIB domain-containing protein n=1 Tax=Sphingobacterium suaedae TaxID=1686402 RepID=A0ABW5KCN5_9SPHI